MRNHITPLLCAILTLAAGSAPALAQTAIDNGWSYQGRLTSAGTLASGPHDLRFTLFSNAAGTTQVGAVQTLTNVQVADGLFTVKLDFGQQFAGMKRWLRVEVRPAGSGSYTALPLQEITSAPQSLFSAGPWQTVANGISYAGNVGIGTTTLASDLTIVGANRYVLHTTTTSSISGTNAIRGIVQSSANTNSAAVLGANQTTGGWGVYGIASGPGSGTGVRGDGRIGVTGTSSNATGFGGYFINTATNGVALWADGLARVKTLQITGGSDLAEPFNVHVLCDSQSIVPGMVVVIDETRTGELRLTDLAYDSKVAGIISGANGLNPGMVMRAEGVEGADGTHPVALTGRVWCYVDASFGAVRAGDRLTTSPTPGHAMVAGDAMRAPGAVIGKAMSELNEGTGLVLVLVNLQ